MQHLISHWHASGLAFLSGELTENIILEGCIRGTFLALPLLLPFLGLSASISSRIN